MIVKNFISNNRALIVAVGISLACHLFWITGISVTIAPPPTRQAQFPRISFLGPIFQGSFTEFRSSGPRTQSSQENEIRSGLRRDIYALAHTGSHKGSWPADDADITPAARVAISFHIKEILGQKKLTPCTSYDSQ